VKGKYLSMKPIKINGVESIATFPVVKGEHQSELLRRIAQGEKSAREELICGSLRLVTSVVTRYFSDYENIDDLFQSGCIGLIYAVDRYDFRYNVKFSTYATEMIFGEIRNYLHKDQSIRISRLLKSIACQVMKVREKFEMSYQRLPTVFELAEEINAPLSEVVLAIQSIMKPISLYQPVCQDENFILLDHVEDIGSNGENWISYIILSEGIKCLSEVERNVIQKHFFEDKTQVETAAELHISQPHVSRCEKQALKKLKSYCL